jgi:DNA-binding transcriptional ArsR family regulator
MGNSGFDNRDHKLLMALEHPLRREILRIMSDEKEISPGQLAERLDRRLANITYHVRVLARCGAVTPAGSKRSGGATQYFYRWALKEKWARDMLGEEQGKPPRGRL